jgi:ABC-type multidrug transport system fused ATPase/permease subunit
VLLLTPEFFLPLRQLAIKYHAGAAGKAAQERIGALLAGEDAEAERQEVASERPPAPMAAGDLVFEAVSCAYPAAGPQSEARAAALDGVSFVLPRGKVTALVGPSGAGKTTVANLLLRFLEPCGGRILAGGQALAAVDSAAWREQVAWVPQQPHIFSGTAAENIALGRPQARRDEVVAAAKAAHAHEFITALPQGYDTPLGEQGVRLSGGQRQRLAIARAFLKDAPFVILDEASASLDVESERLVEDALVRLLAGRTVLVIAHRLHLAAAADQVLVLQEGRLVEQGSHQGLLARDTLYRRLAASNAGEG